MSPQDDICRSPVETLAVSGSPTGTWVGEGRGGTALSVGMGILHLEDGLKAEHDAEEAARHSRIALSSTVSNCMMEEPSENGSAEEEETRERVGVVMEMEEGISVVSPPVVSCPVDLRRLLHPGIICRIKRHYVNPQKSLYRTDGSAQGDNRIPRGLKRSESPRRGEDASEPPALASDLFSKSHGRRDVAADSRLGKHFSQSDNSRQGLRIAASNSLMANKLGSSCVLMKGPLSPPRWIKDTNIDHRLKSRKPAACRFHSVGFGDLRHHGYSNNSSVEVMEETETTARLLYLMLAPSSIAPNRPGPIHRSHDPLLTPHTQEDAALSTAEHTPTTTQMAVAEDDSQILTYKV
ncbi:unnamed protein product [Pleuronectes platessa]|uniref:Uncharacterized protein n=1 Tax=Pleuronectes platessa TaxID=8262 RepID=A0A9N7YWE3_PLEPL|nr:unnamed protein product [Pleuronectes platessa]